MVDVTHDRDNRWSNPGIRVALSFDAAGLEIVALTGQNRFFLVRFPTEGLRDPSSSSVINLLIYVCHHAELHQLFDDFDSGGLQLLGQLADRQYAGECYRLAHHRS